MLRSRTSASSRRSVLCRRIAIAAAVSFGAASAGAATFTYTPPNSATDQWASGTNWNATPVSASDTTLTFVGTNTTVVAAALANTNTNNITGAFSLNILSLQGTGPGAGTVPTITLASSAPSTGLSFVSNAGTLPVLNLTANAGTISLTYTVSQPITLTDNTTIQGSGSAGFLLSGAIGGTGTLTKNGSSAVSLSSGTSNYANGTIINAGAIRVGASSTGAVGSVTAGPLGTGAISLIAGALTARDTTARTINNALNIDGNGTLGSTGTTVNGTLTFGAPATLTGTRNLTVSSPVTFSGGIAESAAGFGFAKVGAGTLTVAGTSNYTGTTTVSAGVLRFNALTAVGGGAGQNLTINVDSALAIGFTPLQSFLDRIVPSSTGAIAFTTDPSAFSFTNLATAFIGVASGSSQSFTGAVPAGTGSLYRLGGGGGTLTLAGTNQLTGANALTTSTGTGGVLVLSGANDFSGTTTVGSAAVLRLANSNAIGSTSGVTVNNGGRIELDNGVVINRPITINGSGGNNIGAIQLSTGAAGAEWAGPITLGLDASRLGTNSLNGVLTISGVIDDGANTFGLNIRNIDGSTGLGSTTLTAANTYGGNTGAVTGTLKIDGGDDRLPVGTTLIIGLNNNTIGSFDLNGRNQRVAAILRSGAVASNTITNTRASTLSTLTVSGTTVHTFDGSVTDTFGTNGAQLALVKMNIGTLTLARANTYTGGTTVQAGSLAGTVDGILGAGDVIVFSGANLILSGGTTNNYIGNTANLLLATGAPNVNLNFTGVSDIIGALSLDGGATFLTPGVYGGGLSTAPLANQFPQFTGTGTVTVTAIPEPATVGLLAVTAGLLSRRRRTSGFERNS